MQNHNRPPSAIMLESMKLDRWRLSPVMRNGSGVVGSPNDRHIDLTRNKELYYGNKTLIGNWYQDRHGNSDNNHAIVPGIVAQHTCPCPAVNADSYGAQQSADLTSYNNWRLDGFRNAEHGKGSSIPLKYPDTFLENLKRSDQLVGHGNYVIDQQRRHGRGRKVVATHTNAPEQRAKYGNRDDFGLRRRLKCKMLEDSYPSRVSTTYCAHYSAPDGGRDPMERLLLHLHKEGYCSQEVSTDNETAGQVGNATKRQAKSASEIMQDLVRAAERGHSTLTMYKLLGAAEKAGVLRELVQYLEASENEDTMNRQKIDNAASKKYPWGYFRREI